MGQGRDDYILVMFQITGFGGRHNMGGHELFGWVLRSPTPRAFLVDQCLHGNTAQHDKPGGKLPPLLFIGNHPGWTNTVDENLMGWCYQKNTNKSRINVLVLWFACDTYVASMSFCKSAVSLFHVAYFWSLICWEWWVSPHFEPYHTKDPSVGKKRPNQSRTPVLIHYIKINNQTNSELWFLFHLKPHTSK